ncbi:hypothetical protein [Streptomyces sp. YIM 98790]|uniref:hypothetical protein n=1 Tax=Streptomyces sp. YIM 98790 TaxID=2689077 RepID=UPI00140E758D|nr:hypothetical protein [Streptomyces sp. YIM 98790]
MRTRALIGPVLAAVLAVGCSSGEESGKDDAIAGSPAPSSEPTGRPEEPEPPEQPDDAADVAALEQLHADYWAAIVELENGAELKPDPLRGIAADLLIEAQLSRMYPIRNSGHVREGEPVVGNVTVTVEGDAATVESCVDEDDWIIVKDGEEVPLDKTGPGPRVFLAERTDGAWLLTEQRPIEEATITC